MGKRKAAQYQACSDTALLTLSVRWSENKAGVTFVSYTKVTPALVRLKGLEPTR